ncbi:hypothetical protein BDZ89DRAFT_6332 [Hymenopellis radicata]|nr:hypothetical protein BDZ89DRAFT_6332 [Hymenopellis radicata]
MEANGSAQRLTLVSIILLMTLLAHLTHCRTPPNPLRCSTAPASAYTRAFTWTSTVNKTTPMYVSDRPYALLNTDHHVRDLLPVIASVVVVGLVADVSDWRIVFSISISLRLSLLVG